MSDIVGIQKALRFVKTSRFVTFCLVSVMTLSVLFNLSLWYLPLAFGAIAKVAAVLLAKVNKNFAIARTAASIQSSLDSFKRVAKSQIEKLLLACSFEVLAKPLNDAGGGSVVLKRMTPATSAKYALGFAVMSKQIAFQGAVGEAMAQAQGNVTADEYILFQKFLITSNGGGWIKNAKATYIPPQYSFHHAGYSTSSNVTATSGSTAYVQSTSTPMTQTNKVRFEAVQLQGPHMSPVEIKFLNTKDAKTFIQAIELLVLAWDSPAEKVPGVLRTLPFIQSAIEAEFGKLRAQRTELIQKAQQKLPGDLATWVLKDYLELDLSTPTLEAFVPPAKPL